MAGRFAWLAGGVALLYLAHAAALAGVAEDAFISFRYARNLVAGAGLVWNPGEAPVEGYTNFLWVLLMAGVLAAGLDPLLGSQLLGVAAGLATLVLTHRCGTVLLGWGPGRALLPCLALALAGPFATWSAAGLETSLFGAALTAALLQLARHAADGRRRDAVLGAVALLVGMLTRPEGLLVAAVLLPATVRSGRGELRREGLVAGAVAVALFGLYFAWRWGYFGWPLPNTFYAKTGGGVAQQLRGASYAGLFGLHYLLPWLPILLLAQSARRRGAAAPPAPPGRRPLLRAAGGLLVGWVAYVVWVGGDYMAMYRFFAPVLAPLYLLLVAGAEPALDRMERVPGAARALALAAGGVAVLGTGIHSTALEQRLLPAPARMHGNWRGVQTERWHVARLRLIGRFFAEYGRSGESLGTDAIGAIGWYSHLAVHGVHGLVDPEIAHAAAPSAGRAYAGHDRRDLARLLAQRPTFVMFTRELRRQRPRGLGVPSDLGAGFEGHYRIRSVWLEDVENGEAGWFSFLERRDRGSPAAAANGVWRAPQAVAVSVTASSRYPLGSDPSSENR